MGAIKVECAWCGEWLSSGERGAVSHGICDACLERHYPKDVTPWRDAFLWAFVAVLGGGCIGYFGAELFVRLWGVNW